MFERNKYQKPDWTEMRSKKVPEEINSCGNLMLKRFNPQVKQKPVREAVIIASIQLNIIA